MMEARRWQRIEEIFHAVVDLPPGEVRDDRMAALCGDDDDLAAEVHRLIAHDQRLQSGGDVHDPHLGLRLGAYEVDALIARGGMAAVYAAHRADEQFHQRVAIKIMDLRLSDPELVALFMKERQILASLEHPAMTRLLDGGVTALGEPYLVMEYVEGVPIDQYCEQHRLDTASRVRLFIEVCAGVACAHRNLVLHRDLKPSNILVTAEGHARIVDFGTATALQPQRLATVSQAPLTPAFASPEQLTGQAVGTASDQYSLGLVLYTLLTDVVPFAGRTSLMAAVERALTGTQPSPVHEAVGDAAAERRQMSRARLRRQLAGDLSTIVAKAIAAEPAGRYASVEHLADDLDRWLRGEVILGRAPSLGYRTSRFVRRHWVAVSIAATLLLSLLAATAVSLQQTARARRQAVIADRESAKTRQLNGFLTRMLSSANPAATGINPGSLTVREVLDGAGQLVEGELGATPELEAEMRKVLGRAFNGLGAPEVALTHLDRALALYRHQEDALGVASTQWQRGVSRVSLRDYKQAEAVMREALAYVREHDGAVDPELYVGATADLAAAIAYQHPGHPEALALMREASQVADRHGLNYLSAAILNGLSVNLIKLGQLDDGETALREALRRWDMVKPPRPDQYSALRNLAYLLFQRGAYVEAEAAAAEALRGYTTLLPVDHPNVPNFKAWWARALLALGDRERGRLVALESYTGYSKLLPKGHRDLALPLITIGIAYRLDGRLQESERVLREARGILEKNPTGAERAADAAGELGLTLRAAGRTPEADALLEESYLTLQGAFGDQHPLTKGALARVRGEQ